MRTAFFAAAILVAVALGLLGLHFRDRGRGLEYRIARLEGRVAALAGELRQLDAVLAAESTPESLLSRARRVGLLPGDEGAGFLVSRVNRGAALAASALEEGRAYQIEVVFPAGFQLPSPEGAKLVIKTNQAGAGELVVPVAAETRNRPGVR